MISRTGEANVFLFFRALTIRSATALSLSFVSLKITPLHAVVSMTLSTVRMARDVRDPSADNIKNTTELRWVSTKVSRKLVHGQVVPIDHVKAFTTLGSKQVL